MNKSTFYIDTCMYIRKPELVSIIFFLHKGYIFNLLQVKLTKNCLSAPCITLNLLVEGRVSRTHNLTRNLLVYWPASLTFVMYFWIIIECLRTIYVCKTYRQIQHLKKPLVHIFTLDKSADLMHLKRDIGYVATACECYSLILIDNIYVYLYYDFLLHLSIILIFFSIIVSFSDRDFGVSDAHF